MLPVLNTRRLDRKVVYFLTLLDEADTICAPLQGPVHSVCFRPNRPDAPSARWVLIAAGAAGRLQFWDVEKGETFLFCFNLPQNLPLLFPENWIRFLQ